MTECPANAEIDCPWFDSGWLIDHPDFPFAAKVAAEFNIEKEK